MKSGGMIEKVKLHGRLRRRRGFMPFNRVGRRFLEDLIDSGNIALERFGKTDYYKLTEIGLDHIGRAGLKKEQVKEARINIRRHSDVLEEEAKRK